uniref:Uncharacterized protein n=1 Tax=Podoviridae sp. ctsUe5 TaxID=2827750 RepID=A0A8S5S5R2_9CAUD|nr:MAG TPA: hypothetical protein [Podoviridae sp. ctsUe5]
MTGALYRVIGKAGICFEIGLGRLTVTMSSHCFEVGFPFLEGGCADWSTFLSVGCDMHLIHFPIGDFVDRFVTQFRIGECTSVELDVEVTDSHNRLLWVSDLDFCGFTNRDRPRKGPVSSQFSATHQAVCNAAQSPSAASCSEQLKIPSSAKSASVSGVPFT